MAEKRSGKNLRPGWLAGERGLGRRLGLLAVLCLLPGLAMLAIHWTVRTEAVAAWIARWPQGEPVELSLSARLIVMGVVAWLSATALIVLDASLRRQEKAGRVSLSERHGWMLAATLAAALLIAVASPDPTLGLQAVGLLLSVVLTLSSTTLVSNALSGIMLRSQHHFRSGDYLRVADHFGMVSDRGLFFTELQTNFSDLVTLPNSFLIQNPVTVIRNDVEDDAAHDSDARKAGTLISALVSIGYDVPHQRVEQLLLEAAEAAGYSRDASFVHVLELGDYTVKYRLTAKLRNLDNLLRQQSQLRTAVLDALHEGGVEIASPALMLQRQLPADEPLIPPEQPPTVVEQSLEVDEDKLMYAKGLESKTREDLAKQLAEMSVEVSRLKKASAAASGDEKESLAGKLRVLQWQRDLVQAKLDVSEKGDAAE